MVNDAETEEPINDIGQLVAWCEQGAKSKDEWCVGIEHETFPFYANSLKPVPYKGDRTNQYGIYDLLEEIRNQLGMQPISYDNDQIVGLTQEGRGSITIEPGGQLELSGKPQTNIHSIAHELDAHLAMLQSLKERTGINYLGLGCRPIWDQNDSPIMPIPRYTIMRNYMPTVGSHGIAMMYHTATTHTSVDYSNEQDMVAKFRVSTALQPLITALFASSPILNCRSTGALSTRAYIWQNTDNNRTGLLSFAFKNDFCFQSYVEWALDVPMYLVRRGSSFFDLTKYGITFRQFLNGSIRYAFPDIYPTMLDWQTHLLSLFPDVRIKSFIEQRSADAGPRDHILALPALWVGLLYDDAVLHELQHLIKDWEFDEIVELQTRVPFNGLRTKFHGRALQELGKEILAMATAGLKARKNYDDDHQDESIYLDPITEIAHTGITLSELLLANYNLDDDLQKRALFSDFSLV